MTRPSRLRARIGMRPSRWRLLSQFAFPLTFIAGGLSFLTVPSLLAPRAEATDDAAAGRGTLPLGYRDPGPVDLIRADELRNVLHQISPESRGLIFEGSADGRAQFILNRRTGASEAEVHGEWDDLFFFQSGVGTVHYGGELVGATGANPRELRGERLAGAMTSTVEPGDVLRIPAGIPHLIEPLGDAPLVYLVIKVQAPKRPAPKPESPPGEFRRRDEPSRGR